MLHRLRNPEARDQHRGRRQVRRAPRRLQVDLRSARPRRHRTTSAQVRVGRIQSEEVEREGAERLLAGFDGILVPGGFGERGIEGKIEAIRYRPRARHSVLRHLPGHAVRGDRVRPQRPRPGRTRTRTEFDKDTPHPVICLLDEQRNVTDKGGTMRLGAQPCRAGRRHARPARPTASERISERHRHRYEFNNDYRQQFAAHGFGFTGTEPRRQAGRDHRAARPPVVPGRAVPPRVQIEADRRPPAVRRASSAPPSTAANSAAQASPKRRRPNVGRASRLPRCGVRPPWRSERRHLLLWEGTDQGSRTDLPADHSIYSIDSRKSGYFFRSTCPTVDSSKCSSIVFRTSTA